MSFLRRFSGQKPSPSPPSISAERPERWYFLSGTPPTTATAFRALSEDQEFQITQPGDATPDGKLLVRYYSALDATGNERMSKGRRLRLDFHGFACPPDLGKPPEPVDEIGRVCTLLSGSLSPGDTEVPLVVVLADSRFDGLMRSYYNNLSEGAAIGAGPARSELVYCDDSNAAKNLLMLYQVKERSPKHDARFHSWCLSKGISTTPFDRVHA